MKQDTPLAILKLLDLAKDQELIGLFKFHESNDHYLNLTDISGRMFFRISKRVASAGSNYISYKPTSDTNTHPNENWILVSEIPKIFNLWLSLVKETYKLTTIFDDPILGVYSKHYSNTITGFENEHEPLNFEQQVSFLNYLDFVEQKIDELEKQQKVYGTELEDIKKEVAELKEMLTRSSQKEVKRKFVVVLSKAHRLSLTLIKEIFMNVAAEGTTKMLGF